MEEFKKQHEDLQKVNPKSIQDQQALQIEMMRKKANEADELID